MQIKITIAILLVAFRVSAQQDYIEYQKIFNRVDSDILKNDLRTAQLRLDTVYNQYTFIYAKHCIKALQINCSVNDFTRADKWLEKCFLHGIPLWMIRANDLTSSVFNNNITTNTINKYDSLRCIYFSNINQPIAHVVDSLYSNYDQPLTKKLNDGFFLFKPFYYLKWRSNNQKHFKIIKDLTVKYGFPGERLIGLPEYFQDSVLSGRNVQFYGPNVFDQRAYIILIHYYSSSNRESINKILLTNVINGFLPSYQFGAFNDFMAEYGKKGELNAYYNVWHTDKNSLNMDSINLRRQEVGLNSYEEQEMIKKINRTNRKANSMNSTITFE